LVPAVLLAAAPASLSAQSMPVATFLAKADTLEKKGPMALFSSDLKLLKAEIAASGKLLRQEIEAARRAGRRPQACLPEKAQTDSRELIAYLRSLAPAQRSMPIKSAFTGLMAKKYPCAVG
jgi:hypothetical protein